KTARSQYSWVHFPIHIPGETVRVGNIHRKADRIIGFVYQANVGRRPIWRISVKRTHSQPSSSPGHEAILRKPSHERSARKGIPLPCVSASGVAHQDRVPGRMDGRGPGAVPVPGRPGGGSQGPGACLSRRLQRLEGRVPRLGVGAAVGIRNRTSQRATPRRATGGASRPGQGQHHGHPAKYRFQRRSSTDAAPPLILTSTSDVTAVVSGLISTVAIPAARANSTGAAMYSKRLLVPTLKTTSNPTPNSNHSRASFSSGTCSPKRTTAGRRIPWQRGQSGGRARSA